MISIESASGTANFIARVRVVEKNKLSQQDSIAFGEGYYFGYRQMRFEIIELFKGDTSSLKIIDTGELTSCNIGIRPGGEYILFGRPFMDKYSLVDYCFQWFILRDKNWQRNWDYEYGMNSLKKLRKIFDHEDTPEPDGSNISRYPDGKLESSEEYLNGELHNNQKVYYANGQLRYDRNYKLGKYDGYFREYSPSGQLLEEEFYVNGQEIRSTYWFDTIPTSYMKINRVKPITDIIIRGENFYLCEEDSIFCMKEYSSKKQLSEETYIFNRKNDDCYTTYKYHDDGSLNYYIEYYRKDKKQIYKQWNEKGKLEFDRVSIDGRVVEDRLKKNN